MSRSTFQAVGRGLSSVVAGGPLMPVHPPVSPAPSAAPFGVGVGPGASLVTPVRGEAVRGEAPRLGRWGGGAV